MSQVAPNDSHGRALSRMLCTMSTPLPHHIINSLLPTHHSTALTINCIVAYQWSVCIGPASESQAQHFEWSGSLVCALWHHVTTANYLLCYKLYVVINSTLPFGSVLSHDCIILASYLGLPSHLFFYSRGKECGKVQKADIMWCMPSPTSNTTRRNGSNVNRITHDDV